MGSANTFPAIAQVKHTDSLTAAVQNLTHHCAPTLHSRDGRHKSTDPALAEQAALNSGLMFYKSENQQSEVSEQTGTFHYVHCWQQQAHGVDVRAYTCLPRVMLPCN